MYFLPACLALFWISVACLDAVLKRCMLSRYLSLLQSGLSVRPGCVQWHSTKWNQTFQRCRRWKPSFQLYWFSIGCIVSCALLPLATLLILKTFLGFLPIGQAQESSTASEQILQPVLPGVNIPLSDAAYYFLTLLFCSVIHEVGHALCATIEDVPVLGVGLFLMGIFPGAFVELSTEQMLACSPCQRLRIFCAGVWHNIVLVGMAVALLWVGPALLSPAYAKGPGMVVTWVDSKSGLSGPAGLFPGDVIVNISDCPVDYSTNWITCLLQKDPTGYCVTEKFSQTDGYFPTVSFGGKTVLGSRLTGIVFRVFLDLWPPWFYINGVPQGTENCCRPDDATGLCFVREDSPLVQRCFPVRRLLENNPSHCHIKQNCSESESCFKPLLANNSLLLELQRLYKKPVLFLGSPHYLIQSVKLSSFIPRYSFCPLSLPFILETQLKYLVAFSSALAFLNVVPCYSLDGYHILSALLDWLGVFSRHRRKNVLRCVTTLGTLLLATSVLLGLYVLFQS